MSNTNTILFICIILFKICFSVTLLHETKDRTSLVIDYFSRYLDDLTIISLELEDVEKNDFIMSNYDLLNHLTLMSDHNNVTFMAYTNPSRSVDYYIPHWGGLYIYNVSQSFRGFNESTLVPINRNLSVFCKDFHPSGTYQPAYCRNPANYQYDILQFATRFLLHAQSLIYANHKRRPEAIGHYIGDVTGAVCYAPRLNEQLGTVIGGNFIWDLIWYSGPRGDRTHKADFMPRYVDAVTKHYILTIQKPIYFGDFWWGFAAIDIRADEFWKIINNTYSFPSTMSILVDPADGAVIFATTFAYTKLFPLTKPDNTYISNIKGIDFRAHWQRMKSVKEAEEKVQVFDKSYVMSHTTLEQIDNWIFIDLALEDEVYPPIVKSVESNNLLLIGLVVLLVIALITQVVYKLKFSNE